MITVPQEEQYAGAYRKLATVMVAQNAHDAMHLLVPMHAEDYVRSLIQHVGYQRSNPNPGLIPWAREITDARHWLINDAYDKWIGEEGGINLSWCADQLGYSADELRARWVRNMRLVNDAETMWLPNDLEKVKVAIKSLKDQLSEYRGDKR